MSQPPYGSPYGPSHQQPDPGLAAPVDPYQTPGQPGYEHYPSSPAHPSYGDPAGYADPAVGYPGTPYQGYGNQGYGNQGYASQGYQADQGYASQGYQVDQGYASQGYQAGQGYQQPQTQPYYQPQPQPQPGYGGPGYPGTPGYPPAPPPSGGGSRVTAVVLVVALVVILVGGGIGLAIFLNKDKGGTPAANGTTPPVPTATSSGGGASPSPTAAVHTGDLRTFLIAAPSGSRPWPTPLGTDRNLSIDQAAQLSTDAKARKDMLQQYSFTKGAVQAWISSGGTDVVDVRLYQFDTAAHASGFFQDNIDATGSGYTADNTSDVASVPGAKSYADPKKNAQGYVSVISIGLKGDVVFVVSIAERGDKVDLGVPAGLMRQQYEKL